MSKTINGRNVRIEVALTFGSTVAPSALTQANPGAVTANAHGQAANTVGFMTVTSGMVELDQQAVMVTGQTTNNFNLAGLDTTNYSAWAAAAGNIFTPAATWALIEESKGYAVGGGASDQLDDTRVWQTKRSNIAGLNAAEDLRVSIAPGEVDSTAMAFINRYARNGASCLFKISSLTTGKVLRIAYGVPSVYDENLDVGALGTGGFSVTVPGFVTKPNV